MFQYFIWKIEVLNIFLKSNDNNEYYTILWSVIISTVI